MTHRSFPLLFVAIGLLPGCEQSLKVRNNEPAATIVYPVAGTDLVDGHVVTLRGSITDTNDHPEELVATWLLGEDVLCEAAPIGEDGSTTCEARVEAGRTVFTLVGSDPEGAEGSADVEVDVRPNDAPRVEITSPVATDTFVAGEYVVFEARVSDTEEAAEDLVLTWTDTTGATVALDTEVDSAGGLSGAIALEAGTHVFTLTATDAPGAVGGDAVTVEVIEEE